MISLKEALQQHIRKPGRPHQYRVNKLTFCTCDRSRNTGGKRITLLGARLKGEPSPKELNSERVPDPEKHYRRGRSFLNFYDEETKENFRVHIDLIEFVNDLEIS